MNDKEAKRFYNSKQWKIKRICILERDNYECCDCRERLKEAAVKGVYLNPEQRKIHMAADVHHIKSLKEHPELRLDDPIRISRVHCSYPAPPSFSQVITSFIV